MYFEDNKSLVFLKHLFFKMKKHYENLIKLAKCIILLTVVYPAFFNLMTGLV